MSLEYTLNNKNFSLSYQDLKTDYEYFCEMTDQEFLKHIKEVLHHVCIVSYLKEIRGQILLKDDGLIHELVHLLDDTEPVNDLTSIRETFKELMKLS